MTASLGFLSGTPGARAMAKAKAKAQAKAEAKATAAQNRRSAFISAMSWIYGMEPRQRPQSSVERVTEEAFDLASELERAIDDTTVAVEVVGLGSLDKKITLDVQNSGTQEASPSMSGIGDITIEHPSLQCCSCKEIRIVPKGTFLTYKDRESKFYCRFAGAKYRLTKRRRVA